MFSFFSCFLPASQGARGGYGDSNNLGEAFFIENVFEELDADNEFYFDEDTRVLYYFKSHGSPAPVIHVPHLKTLVSLVGASQQRPVVDVALKGAEKKERGLER